MWTKRTRFRFGGHLTEYFALAASLMVMTAFGSELKIKVQSFPPGQDLKPGVAVLLSVDGLEEGQVATWHRVAVEGDVVLTLDRYHLFAGTASGPRTFIVQVAAPGADPFAITSFAYGTKEDPAPNPTPTPVPPGEKLVVIVAESLKPNPDHVLAAAKLGLWLTQKEKPFRRTDPNQKEAGKTPAWLQVVLDSGKPLPVLAVVAKSSAGVYSVVGVEPLPKTLDAAKANLAKWGVE